MKILKNQFDIETSHFDYEAINKKFDFFLITNEKGNYKPNARIFDDVLLQKNVLAVQYTGGTRFILMLKKTLKIKITSIKFVKNTTAKMTTR